MSLLGVLIDATLLVVFLILLDRSSYAVITGASGISSSTRMRFSNIGFIFVALSTSLPEAVVSLFAAWGGTVGLAVGNVFGSNIANVCLIVGLPVVYGCLSRLRPVGCSLNLGERESSSLFFGLFFSSALPLILLRSAKYGSLIGLALVVTLLAYSYSLSKSSVTTDLASAPTDNAVRRVLVRGVAWMLAGIVGVTISGYVIVTSASSLAAAFSLSGTLIGATLVAVGTSLPELAISLKSVQAGRMDFALANAVGSCFANLTIIMGLVFIFSKITVRIDAYFDLVFFSLLSNLVLWYFLTRGRLSAKEGLVLILIYAVFMAEFVGLFTLF